MQQDLGKRIRNLREDAHMSQAELAREIQVSRQAVSRWESGSSVPDASIVSDLCRALGVKYESVFGAFELGEGAASMDESIQTAGEEALKEQNFESTEEIKNRLDALLAERKKNNRKRILSATVWTMFAAAALFCVVQFVGARLAGIGDLERPHTLFFHRIRDQYRRRCAFAAGHNFSHCHYRGGGRIDMLGADSQGGEEQEVGEARPSSCLFFVDNDKILKL